MVKIRKVNPIEILEDLIKQEFITIDSIKDKSKLFEALKRDIKYNPDINKKNCKYKRIECMNHDGTLLFYGELFSKLLERLLNKSSYYLPDLYEVDEENVINILYEIGDITIIDNYNPKLEKSWMMRTCMVMPVISEFVIKED